MLYGKPEPDATVDTSELADGVSLRCRCDCETVPEQLDRPRISATLFEWKPII